MVQGPPDPTRAGPCRPDRLQVLPRDREHRGHPLNRHVPASRKRLEALGREPVPDDLRAWARHLASPSGGIPLLGADADADPYPALLWNGARLHRAGADPADGLTLVALAAAPDLAPEHDLERGIAAGVRVASALAGHRDSPSEDVGRPTLGVLPAAACAFVVRGGDPDDLATVLDIAGTLMVVGPPSRLPGAVIDVPARADADVRAGHCLAAGWLAPRLLDAGLVATEGALDSTLASVSGRDPAGLMGRLR